MPDATALRFGSGRGTPERIHEAIETNDPLPGTGGFAGAYDGRLVRDVLGRVPLFVEAGVLDSVDEAEADPTSFSEPPGPGSPVWKGIGAVEPQRWGHRPTVLEEPVAVPAGTIAGRNGAVARKGPGDWRLPQPEPIAESLDRVESALERVSRAELESTARADGSGEGTEVAASTAVAFSGGVDSALLAAFGETPLYVVGLPDGHDVEAARSAAAAMGRADDLRVRELSIEDVERAVPTVARAIDRTNAMDVAIATAIYLVASAAATDGIDRLVLGQGADELFGGYEKVATLDHRVDATTVRGAVREQLATLPTQLERDVLAVEAAGVEPVTPYLHDAVVEPALALPDSLLVAGSTRKVGLRRIAREHLPADVADRSKKALQYGTLVSRELDRLARRAGYKRRMDDHVRRYVESRLEG
ncbi:asparagine synthase C-terminal domain-containing protein [Halovivax limisalsi]|uniref:asparagine synthase C-terminal domain-containing protein n=1 Tax=Halovivax limisalsi TaxID=1453760 RepID=UPI001FFCFEDA|nr:asparagine synthase-related protein [Halovivax limisalsi]